jgi:hypothetical protein
LLLPQHAHQQLVRIVLQRARLIVAIEKEGSLRVFESDHAHQYLTRCRDAFGYILLLLEAEDPKSYRRNICMGHWIVLRGKCQYSHVKGGVVGRTLLDDFCGSDI